MYAVYVEVVEAGGTGVAGWAVEVSLNADGVVVAVYDFCKIGGTIG